MSPASTAAARLKERAKKIKLVLMDIDGVLTDGLLYHFVDTQGQLVELKGVNTQDSIALSWLAESGLRTGCISGRVSEGMAQRLKMLKASYIFQGRLDKRSVFDQICREGGFSAAEALYMGDDLPDLPVLKACGLAVAVANARQEVKDAAHWITEARGGQGALREVTEFLLKTHGVWDALLKRFS